MQLRLSAPKIWLANEAVDFRNGANGLSAKVAARFDRALDNELFIFFNRSKTSVKLLAYHRNGLVLICKRLDRKRFTLSPDESSGLYELSERQLSWLLAGLDWVEMSGLTETSFDDYC